MCEVRFGLTDKQKKFLEKEINDLYDLTRCAEETRDHYKEKGDMKTYEAYDKRVIEYANQVKGMEFAMRHLGLTVSFNHGKFTVKYWSDVFA